MLSIDYNPPKPKVIVEEKLDEKIQTGAKMQNKEYKEKVSCMSNLSDDGYENEV